MSTELEKGAKPAERAQEGLKDHMQALDKAGGFKLLESLVEGIQNLNPGSKARRDIFLKEAPYAKDRKALAAKLGVWLEILASSDSVPDVIRNAEERSEKVDQLFKSNLRQGLEATAEMERAYRTVNMFFKNTESDKLKNVHFMNVGRQAVGDLDNPEAFEAVESEFKDCYDRLDLRDNYGLLVLPGYIGDNQVVDKWGKMCHKNKVTMVTDFRDLDTPDEVIDMFQKENMAGGDVHKSNVVMAANWLIGRGKAQEVGEDRDVRVPPSAALAGKIYRTLMSQVTAGKKHGSLSEVGAVAFDVRKSEIAAMEKAGLVPMVNEYGKVMAFSAKTLFNGDNIGLQTYSVVRTFDYISKVLQDFLNRRAFENFDSKTEREIRAQIVKFLDNVTGPGKLIEKFKLLRFEKDPVQKDRIYLDIHMTPYFPAKNYVFKLDGQKGDDPDSAEWQSQYAQE